MNTTKLFSLPFSETELKINCVSADLEIRGSEESKVIIEITLDGQADKVEHYEPRIKRTTNSLEVDLEYEGTKVSFMSIGRHKDIQVRKAVITIPPTVDLYVSNIAGDVRMVEPNCKERLTLSAVSGDIYISDVSCSELSVKSTSGDIRLTSLKRINQLKISSVSGDTFAQNIVAKELSAETVSGDIVMKNVGSEFRQMVLKTISGDMKIEVPILPPSKIEFSTLSGSVKVGQRFLSGVKGSLETAPSPIATIKVNTLSGDVSIDAFKEEQSYGSNVQVFMDLIRENKATPEQVREMMALMNFSEDEINKVLGN
ncbi:DUF4097 family beta strand repeat-containing protein [Coprothermobacter platensis]|uniref:DUF4097 family beta strand repeat-containing protein n=1 Tax=Coprothermobacter platensis TaxID=108819 RepID=UPI00038249F8|nr:DUF4097 family beta strand repeat-containing protein [Coprothermobacter platensis]